MVDSSYVVHADMKSQTRGALTLGKGTVYATSLHQKINTRSSMETEVVAVYDMLLQVMWMMHFLSAQGYRKYQSILFQDNLSAILLEKNGRASSGKWMQHMNV